MLKTALNASVFLHALSCVCQLTSLANSADTKHISITTITQLFLWCFLEETASLPQQTELMAISKGSQHLIRIQRTLGGRYCDSRVTHVKPLSSA